MALISIMSFILSLTVVKRANAKFKREEMDKKLNSAVFETYKTDHISVHDKENKDMMYIRIRVDQLADHFNLGKAKK